MTDETPKSGGALCIEEQMIRINFTRKERGPEPIRLPLQQQGWIQAFDCLYMLRGGDAGATDLPSFFLSSSVSAILPTFRQPVPIYMYIGNSRRQRGYTLYVVVYL